MTTIVIPPCVGPPGPKGYQCIIGDSPSELQDGWSSCCGVIKGQGSTTATTEFQVPLYRAAILASAYGYKQQKRREWMGHTPAPWSNLKVKVVRGESGLDAAEEKLVLDGGFWQPTVVPTTGDSSEQEKGGSFKRLSKYMQQRMRLMQQDADEVLSILIDSKRQLAASVSSSAKLFRRKVRKTAKHTWRVLQCAFCCASEQGDGYYEFRSSNPLYQPADDPPADDGLIQAAEDALIRRTRHRLANATSPVWLHTPDSNLTPLLPAIDSAVDLEATDDWDEWPDDLDDHETWNQ